MGEEEEDDGLPAAPGAAAPKHPVPKGKASKVSGSVEWGSAGQQAARLQSLGAFYSAAAAGSQDSKLQVSGCCEWRAPCTRPCRPCYTVSLAYIPAAPFFSRPFCAAHGCGRLFGQGPGRRTAATQAVRSHCRCCCLRRRCKCRCCYCWAFSLQNGLSVASSPSALINPSACCCLASQAALAAPEWFLPCSDQGLLCGEWPLPQPGPQGQGEG